MVGTDHVGEQRPGDHDPVDDESVLACGVEVVYRLRNTLGQDLDYEAAALLPHELVSGLESLDLQPATTRQDRVVLSHAKWHAIL